MTESPVPVLVTRRMLLVAGAVFGLTLALTVGGVIAVYLFVSEEQSDRIDANAKVIKRLDRIEEPQTPAELRAAIRRALITCAKDPDCRRLLSAVAVKGASSLAKPRGPNARRADLPSGQPKTETPLRRLPGIREPSAPPPSSRDRAPSRPGEPPSSAPPRPPGRDPEPPPANPRPPVDLGLDGIPVRLCTAIVSVNCR